MGGEWTDRREVLTRGIQALTPDLIAFQEVFKDGAHDTAVDVVGSDYHVAHQTTGLLGDGNGAAIASRWPIGRFHELDQQPVCYRDAWESAHPDDPGLTFTTANPLVLEDSDVRQEVSRRIDYVFVRCDQNGPTLEISACELAVAEPVDGVWATHHLGVVADLAPSPR